MAEIYQIFSMVFWKIDDFISTFWHYLTFILPNISIETNRNLCIWTWIVSKMHYILYITSCEFHTTSKFLKIIAIIFPYLWWVWNLDWSYLSLNKSPQNKRFFFGNWSIPPEFWSRYLKLSDSNQSDRFWTKSL